MKIKYTDLNINTSVTVRIWKGDESRKKVAEKYKRMGYTYNSSWIPLATIFYNNPADPNGRGIRVVPYDCTKCSYTHTLQTIDTVTGKQISIDRYLLKRELIIRKAIKKAYSTGDGAVLHGVSEELYKEDNQTCGKIETQDQDIEDESILEREEWEYQQYLEGQAERERRAEEMELLNKNSYRSKMEIEFRNARESSLPVDPVGRQWWMPRF